jgi:hypothetical protein
MIRNCLAMQMKWSAAEKVRVNLINFIYKFLCDIATNIVNELFIPSQQGRERGGIRVEI